ncbi:MAG: hypothetical protein AAF327_17445 [Cyanobacteria bacterium P01_A01_bin.37]
MHLWIVTIGSSDVQLDSDRTCKEKKRTPSEYSEKVWRYWYTDDIKADCNDIDFSPKTLFPYKDETYRISPRILGTVYQAKDQVGQDEIFSYLTFPLLDNFVKELETSPKPEAIAIILTDQSTIFQADQQREKIKSPYWLDTCELKPILESYFEDRFPEIPREWIALAPTSADQSLDNWDTVLELVRQQFYSLIIRGEDIKVAPDENVYVSHQAGTPAISSAVQFMSLAMFGDRVKFLVSNEYNPQLTGLVNSSNYLRGIEIHQAKKLLEDRYDYPGVKEILQRQINEAKDSDREIKYVEYLLNAAIQWNFAEFEEFKTKLLMSAYPRITSTLKETIEKRTEEQNWWWTAYEAAWLGVVRLKQGNTVEAMFHSFRALEGLAISYADRQGLARHGKKVFRYLKSQKQKQWKEHSFISDLVNLDDDTEDLLVRRNGLFHNLLGFTKEDLFIAWNTDENNWQKVITECLNLISDQDFHVLKEVSLMAKVHKELESAIAHL